MSAETTADACTQPMLHCPALLLQILLLCAGILNLVFEFAFVSLQLNNQVQLQKFLGTIALQKIQNMKQSQLGAVLLK